MPTNAAFDQEKSELDSVLSSGILERAPNLAHLLTYICTKYFDGASEQIKEYNIAVEALGRPTDFDQKKDSIVRVEAHKLRKRLREYYESEGADHPVRIEIPSGQYTPKFIFQHAGVPDAAETIAVSSSGAPYTEPGHEREIRITETRFPAGGSTGAAPLPLEQPETRVEAARTPPTNSIRRRLLLGIATVAVLLLSAVIALAIRRKTNLDLFWAPVTQQPGPVLICMGQPIVYTLLSAQAQASLHGIDPSQPPLKSPADEGPAKKDLVILPDRYLALGDAFCLVRLTALFERYGKAYRIRGQRSTSFADLRENPAVLIAAFDNQWTLHATGQLRFTFVKDSAHDIDMVRDSQHPENREWKLVGAWPYWDVANDYAIVSRVRDGNSDRPIVIAAGITQYGTMATGEFLTTPDYLSDAISKLPDGWQKKNLQIVLRVPVVRGTPGRPRVLATHVW